MYVKPFRLVLLYFAPFLVFFFEEIVNLDEKIQPEIPLHCEMIHT